MNKHSEEKSIQQEPAYDTAGSLATNVADDFTVVAVGDLIITRPLTKSEDQGFRAVVKILHDADVTFGNMETNIFDVRTFKGSPQAEYGGAYHVSLPELGPDLSAMGFNLVSYANNHTFDWGIEGMRETSRVLDQNGIVHAGIGENLAQAGAPRYLETARGRVALVSFATTFTPMSRACDPAGGAPGRPGLNSLRLTKSVAVPEHMLEGLRRVASALPDFKQAGDHLGAVMLGGVTYTAGAIAAYSYQPNPRDVSAILRNVRQGKQFADFCIATNHGHEPGNWSDEPADYEQSVAHRLIDAGADSYIAHGPHRLRGIEIYKGRPIFYSLGNFFMDDLRSPVGADMFDAYEKNPQKDTDAEVTVAEMGKGFSNPIFYESIVAISRYEQNRLAELRLYPIELGYRKRFANRGIPQLASLSQAQEIIGRMQRLSEPFGTHIEVVNGVGVIQLESSP